MTAIPKNLRDTGLISAAILGTGLVLLLALDGGGYGPVLRGQVGVLIWWVLLIGCATGLLPVTVPGRLAALSAGLFALFVAWVGLSLIWTESFERTMADLARLATYLGVFVLALATKARYGVRRMVGAVGIAIVAVAAIALVARLFPDIYPDAAETARLLPVSGNRLSFPLNYWNGLGAFVGMGLPLMLYVATAAKSNLTRSAAASAIPLLAVTVFLTYSRSAIGATLIAVCVFYVLCGDRVSRLPVLLVATVGSAILIWLSSQFEFVSEGPLAQSGSSSEGVWMLAATVVVCVFVGLIHLLMLTRNMGLRAPRFVRPPAGVLLGVAVALLGVLLVSAIALDVPDRADRAWQEFKQTGSTEGRGAERLQSFSGNNRYQFWEAAVEQNRSRPLIGRGAGTFELWSNRSDDTSGFVRDAHSLYLETLGELGLVGFLLLIAFLLTVLIGGWGRVRRSSRQRRPQMAAVFAACVIPVVTAAVDWTWELPVVPVAFLLLVAVLVSAGDSGRASSLAGGAKWAIRGGIPVVAIATIVAIAIPTASSALIERSQTAVREGDLQRALDLASDAVAVEPAASSPRLQRALVLESMGYPDEALTAARAATERESTNWRPWLVRSRLEAEIGDFGQAVASFRRARELNSNSPLLGSG